MTAQQRGVNGMASSTPGSNIVFPAKCWLRPIVLCYLSLCPYSCARHGSPETILSPCLGCSKSVALRLPTLQCSNEGSNLQLVAFPAYATEATPETCTPCNRLARADDFTCCCHGASVCAAPRVLDPWEGLIRPLSVECAADHFQGHVSTVSHVLNQPQCNIRPSPSVGFGCCV